MIYTVTLEEIEFKANHGLYAFEKEKGNTFYLTVTIEKNLNDDYEFIGIEKTIDYEIIYKIAYKHIYENTDLLEQIIQKIGVELRIAFVDYKKIYIKLAKSDPPIGAKCKKSEVSCCFLK